MLRRRTVTTTAPTPALNMTYHKTIFSIGCSLWAAVENGV
jgi:hypothetical protein